MTAKLILNVAYHGWEMKVFRSRLPKMALNSNFLAFDFTEKTTFIMCQKSFKTILNYIMQNSTYTQEKIISASVKTLQIKLFLLSPTMLFTLRSACMSSIATLVNKVYTAIKNVPYCHQTINLAVGTMVESLHTWLKTSLEMWFLCLKRVTLINLSEASHNLLQRKVINLWDWY